MKVHYVYVAHATRAGIVKLGRSSNLRERMINLQCVLRSPIDLCFVGRCPNRTTAHAIEQMAHVMLFPVRVEREVYQIEPSTVIWTVVRAAKIMRLGLRRMNARNALLA